MFTALFPGELNTPSKMATRFPLTTTSFLPLGFWSLLSLLLIASQGLFPEAVLRKASLHCSRFLRFAHQRKQRGANLRPGCLAAIGHGANAEHFHVPHTTYDDMLHLQYSPKRPLSLAAPSSSVAIFKVPRLSCRRLQTHLLSFCSAIWHLCIRRRLHICQAGGKISFPVTVVAATAGGGRNIKKLNPVDHMEGFFLSDPS